MTLGAHGATARCTPRATSARRTRRACPWPPRRSLPPSRPASGAARDAIFLGTTYDGRDVAGRLSVAKIDAAGHHQRRRHRARRATVAVGTASSPVFGGTVQDVYTKFTTSASPQHLPRSGRSRSPPRSPGGGAGCRAGAEPCRISGAAGGARIVKNRSRGGEATGPQLDEAAIVVLGWSWPGRVAATTSSSKTLAKAAQGAAPGASRAIVDAGWGALLATRSARPARS